jgi:uncharacterized protein YbbC (DUF1343 family)
MGLALETAAQHGLRFVVLDRPNPINGVDVEGPMLDGGRESFVGYHSLPIRHGMTVGELALMFKDERELEVHLDVVRMHGWRRSDFFDSTGLPWVNPSPNIRNLTAAILYPGIGLFERTNLSVGRGTESPFEFIGAPWIDRDVLASKLNERRLEGVRFEPISFTPTSSKFSGQSCGGVRIVLINRAVFRPVRTSLEIADHLRALYGSRWRAQPMGYLLGNETAVQAIMDGKPATEIETAFQEELERFVQRRQQFLLYD